MENISIRPAQRADLGAIRDIFRFHIAAGETYPFDTDMTPEAATDYWLGPAAHTFVAADGERVLGMYRVVANQAGRGSHVANASYMVSPQAQGRGIGKLLGRHSLEEARRLGYLAMQFNYVVSTNSVAVELWKKLGFSIVATLPGAYRHSRLGYVDAYVMYQVLVDRESWPA